VENVFIFYLIIFMTSISIVLLFRNKQSANNVKPVVEVKLVVDNSWSVANTEKDRNLLQLNPIYSCDGDLYTNDVIDWILNSYKHFDFPKFLMHLRKKYYQQK